MLSTVLGAVLSSQGQICTFRTSDERREHSRPARSRDRGSAVSVEGQPPGVRGLDSAVREAVCALVPLARACTCMRRVTPILWARKTNNTASKKVRLFYHCAGSGRAVSCRHAVAVFENYSRTDSFLQQPARRPVGSRAGAARPVTTTVPAGTVPRLG